MSISVADNFKYQGTKPLDDRIQFSSVANMKAYAEANLYNGCMAYVTATKKYYSYDSSNTVDETTGKWREYSSGGGSSYTAGDGIVIDEGVISTDNLQSGDMSDIVSPVPSPSPLSVALNDLTNVSLNNPQNGNALVYDSENELWVNGEGGGGGGTTYTAGDGIDITNDVISTDNLQSGDMDDVIPTLPSVRADYIKYSTTEQVVGEWINRKPLYEITYYSSTDISISATRADYDLFTLANLDFMVDVTSTYKFKSENRYWNIPFMDFDSPSSSNKYVFTLYYDITSQKVKIRANFFAATTIEKLAITIRYTKTTD